VRCEKESGDSEIDPAAILHQVGLFGSGTTPSMANLPSPPIHGRSFGRFDGRFASRPASRRTSQSFHGLAFAPAS